MNFKNSVIILFIFTSLLTYSQEESYTAFTIAPELKKNANAVIRNHDIVIDLHSYSNMTIRSKRVVTILNKNGLTHLDSYIYYDPEIRIKSISAKVYDAFGKELKKIKRKDFKDYSASGSNLFSDNRVLALDYTPIEYPFTFVFETETQTNSTAFYPRWYPVENYFLSTENSSYKIINHESIALDVKGFNLETEGIENVSSGNLIHYKAKNLQALKWESMSPAFKKVAPLIMVAPEKFRLVNVDGHAKSWSDFGKWNFNNLIKHRNAIPASTLAEINTLVKAVEDPIEKAKLIYQYVQDKTRYISVQLGVGGWQPMLASKVDEVSYGDCKALTNYTMALLQSQDITAYYTVLWGDNNLRDIESDFVGMQGNHVILNIPNGESSIWLECTSQKVPFGHIANFTDDRDVLVITPEGGRIEHTRVYTSQENYLKAKAVVRMDENGGFNGDIILKSGGSQYDDRLKRIIDIDQKDKTKYYNNYWSYINGFSINTIEIDNNRDAIEITEKLSIKTPSYAVSAGDKFLVAPNVFNRYTNLPPRYSNRKLPFVIERGFYDQDEYEIQLPEGFSIESLPENKEIETKFGVYKMSLEKINDSQIIYKRSLEINKGNYQKEDYKAYRSFRRKLAKADKTSFVLNKTN